jgi:uncharacterized membrane protein YkoI
MRNTIHILLVAATLAGGALGCTHAQAAEAAKPQQITMEQAEAIALKRIPGGVIESIERDRELGKLVYEVEVRAPDGRDHDLVIDAADGRVLSEEIDD